MSIRDDKYTHRHFVEQFKHYPIDREGYVVDELPFSNKSILRIGQEIRSSLVRSALKSGQDLTDFMVQVLGCVELEEVDRNECPCAPASGCYWLKTKIPIPEFIEMISVTGVVANKENPRFTYLKWDRFQYIPTARSRATREGRYWTLKYTSDTSGPYLYLYGDRFLETLSLAAIFEDPILAATYPSCGTIDENALCNPLDVGFYTDSWMREQILSAAWQKLIPVRQAAGADVINNDTSLNAAQK